jgi:Flp pilus assembly pilin Flp
MINNFMRGDQGRILIEFTLLLAFVAPASAALFVDAGGSVSGIWTSANTQLANPGTAAA